MKTGYVLVTPARNEGRYITETIESVLAQTILPKRWVIVSDGSTDDTECIVSRYSAQHRFITLLRRSGDATRNYGSKVRAIWAGSEELRGTEYDFIGILDADLSLASDYYERILTELDRNPRLGIAGGYYGERDARGFRVQSGMTERSVPGAVQVFRRQCYEEIGGLYALRYGGEDTAANEMARMNGWEVRAFSDLLVSHHRRLGTEGMGILAARFRHGLEDYCIGYHPLFEFGKCLRRLAERPYLVGSVCRLSGYLWGGMTRQKRELPIDFIRYLRKQQMRRLRGTGA